MKIEFRVNIHRKKMNNSHAGLLPVAVNLAFQRAKTLTTSHGSLEEKTKTKTEPSGKWLSDLYPWGQ